MGEQAQPEGGLRPPLCLGIKTLDKLVRCGQKAVAGKVFIKQNGVVTLQLGHLSIDLALGGYPTTTTTTKKKRVNSLGRIFKILTPMESEVSLGEKGVFVSLSGLWHSVKEVF